ncbi:hypothetical protein JCM8097_006324 [Rhodosporidiobolus ruineniae]
MEALLAHLGRQRKCVRRLIVRLRMSSTYTLDVVQQPVRARMCGFGDKDRRPISPPLIVKLTAKDVGTGEEVTVDDLDTTFLILAADLRTPDTYQDANLIHGATGNPAPSRSSQSRTPTPPRPPFEHPSPAESFYSGHTTPAAGSPPKGLLPLQEEPLPSGFTAAASPEEDQKPFIPSSPKRQLSHDPPTSLSFPPGGPSPSKRLRTNCDPPPPSAADATNSPNPSSFIPYARDRRRSPALVPAPTAAAATADSPPIPNLIGTLHTNAYKLKGLEGEQGVYFVLPDLSVRTEGNFRLRLRLLNVGLSGGQTNTGTAVVATEHTNEFRVFSAKKFEGMLDPTALSQCFAKQGVRIPTRKVAKSRSASTSTAGGSGGAAGGGAAPLQSKAAALVAAAQAAAQAG